MYDTPRHDLARAGYHRLMSSIASLFDRFLRPRREKLETARTIVRHHTDSTLAWTALHERGLIPATWRDDPRRRFPWLAELDEYQRAEKLRWAPFVTRSPCPDDVKGCALLAADVDGVEAAETCARKLVAGLGAWGIPAADTVLWVPTRLDDYGYQLTDTKPNVWEPESIIWRAFPAVPWEPIAEVIHRTAAELRTRSADAARAQTIARLLGPWLFAREQWAEAVRTKRQSPFASVRFAELADPTEALFGLFETGYVLLPSLDVLVLGYPVD